MGNNTNAETHHVESLPVSVLCSVSSMSELPVDVAPPVWVKRHNMGTTEYSGAQVVIGPDADMQANLVADAPPEGVKEHSKGSEHDHSNPGPINTSVQQGLPDFLGGTPAVVTAPVRVKRYSRKTTHDENQGGPKNTSRQAFASDAFANVNGESLSLIHI